MREDAGRSPSGMGGAAGTRTVQDPARIIVAGPKSRSAHAQFRWTTLTTAMSKNERSDGPLNRWVLRMDASVNGRRVPSGDQGLPAGPIPASPAAHVPTLPTFLIRPDSTRSHGNCPVRASRRAERTSGATYLPTLPTAFSHCQRAYTRLRPSGGATSGEHAGASPG